MFKQKPKPKTPADKMFYTPHTDAEIEQLADRFASASDIAETLTRKATQRGTNWDDSVDIQLARLNSGMAQEKAAADDTPKVKATTLQFRCVARAAVTAQLEITKGLRELALGWIEVGDVVQAKALGTTHRTGRQRILDAAEWEQGAEPGAPTDGWISIHAVDGTPLLEPVGVQDGWRSELSFQPLQSTIRTDTSGWGGAARRLGVGFEYDATFLPPPSDKLGKDGLKRRDPRALTSTRMSRTPEVSTARQREMFQDEASRRSYSGTVRSMFNDAGTVNRDVKQRRLAQERHLAKYPWPPKEDAPPPLAFGHQPEKHVGYYSEGPSNFLDGDYLAHIAKRYPDQALIANLTAERTKELDSSYSGIRSTPSSRGKPSAIDLGALDPGRSNRRRPRTSDGALRLSWAQHCLSHDDAPGRGAMGNYVSMDFEGAEWLALEDKSTIGSSHDGRPRTAPDGYEATKRLQGSSGSRGHLAKQGQGQGQGQAAVVFGDAGDVAAPTRMRTSDQKRYSAYYAAKLSDQGRQTIKSSGVLACQRSSVNKEGSYRRGGDAVARKIIEEEQKKIMAEQAAEIARIKEERNTALQAEETRQFRIVAERKAKEETIAEAKLLRERLDLVLDLGGIEKIQSLAVHSTDEEIRDTAQGLMDALHMTSSNEEIQVLLHDVAKEQAGIRLEEMESKVHGGIIQGINNKGTINEGTEKGGMWDWSEEEAKEWAVYIGLLLHTTANDAITAAAAAATAAAAAAEAGEQIPVAACRPPIAKTTSTLFEQLEEDAEAKANGEQERKWIITTNGSCTLSDVLRIVFESNRLDGRDLQKISMSVLVGYLWKAGLTDCNTIAGCNVIEAGQLVIKRRDDLINWRPPPTPELLKEQAAAATKIQARHRGRTARDTVARILQPEAEPDPDPDPDSAVVVLKYIKPSIVHRLAAEGNVEALHVTLSRANGVESLGRRIKENDIAYENTIHRIEVMEVDTMRNSRLTMKQQQQLFSGRVDAFESYAARGFVKLQSLYKEKATLESRKLCAASKSQQSNPSVDLGLFF